MSFTPDEEKILAYLACHRCITPQTAKRREAMDRDLGPKIRDYEGILRSLIARGFVGTTKKGAEGKIHHYVNTDVLGYLKERGLWSFRRNHPL